MGKIKSAICLTLITIVIAVLCVTCFVPFPLGGEISFYNPILNWTDKSADLGGLQYGGTDPSYVGGSYEVVLYPEGVISATEYEDNLAGLPEDEREDYAKGYVAYADGPLYFEKDTVCGKGETVTEDFKASFAKQVELLEERFERLHAEDLSLRVADDYTVRVALPASMDASIAAFLYFSYMGDVTVRYGSDEASATQIIPETGRKEKPVSEYISGAGSRVLNGTVYVSIAFTEAGRAIIANTTAGASDSSGTLFFMVGDSTVINLTVSSPITEGELFISGSYTADTANVVSIVLDTAAALEEAPEFGMEMGELYRRPANFGENALMFVYIAIGAAFLAMAVFFLIRYGRLGFAHIYSYLIFLLAMVLCVWAIPLVWGVAELTAFLLASVLLGACDALSYEYVRKEFATGKTMSSSVKAGYKKCFWHIFDLHIVLAVVAALVYAISVAELAAFGLVLLLGVVFSAICTLAINRFMWYIMMPFAKSPAKFCHFKREEVEDDE